MQLISVEKLIQGLRLNSEDAMIDYLSKTIGTIYWCDHCKQIDPEHYMDSLGSEVHCNKCQNVVEHLTLKSFI